jgi:Bacterial SH3 domain
MRIARVVGSLPRLRRWFVTRLSPERVIFNTAFEEPAQAVSSVHVKPGLADQTPSKSLLTLSAIRVLAAALVVVTLIPNLILGAIFCAGCLFAELRERAAVFGRRLRVSDRRKRGTHIAGALGSLPHLPQQLAPTLRSRRPRGRSQWNVYTAVEKPAQRASSVNVRPIFADRARLVSSSLNCALVAGLILLALIPNLVLGGIFWLGAVNISWSRFPTHTADDKTVAPQSVVPAPVLSSPPTMEASVGRDIPFPIALDGTDGVPARSIIAVRGLPQGSKLSSGRPYDETEWNLKPDEIGDLHLVLPNNARGEAKLIVQLVAVDGAVITDTTTFLEILTNSAETKIEPTQTQVLGERGKAVEEKHAEVAHANLNAATVTPEDPIQLPLRRPIQSSSDDARWTVLTAVNLRERPTRSAPAIGVVAKGTKLYLISRQRSWVRVNNPATSEEGWIYGRHVAVASLR